MSNLPDSSVSIIPSIPSMHTFTIHKDSHQCPQSERGPVPAGILIAGKILFQMQRLQKQAKAMKAFGIT